jgi:hypothetical protein
MTNELKPFTAGDLAANMQGKIRQVIADSLPEDAINELIDNEIKSFFQPRKGYYASDNKDSQFKELINKLVAEELSTKMKDKFSTLLNGYWVAGGEAQFGVELEAVVTKLAPAFMESYFKSMAASMIQSLNYNRPS